MAMKREAAWTALDTFLSSGLAFLFRLLVAKTLLPEDFGVAAIALTIVMVLQVVNDFGLTSALIQKDEEHVTPSLVNTTFTASLIVTIVLILFTVLVVAPVAANFYGKATLEPLLMVLAITMLPSPFSTIAAALLFRKRRFREAALIRSAATISGLLVAGTVLLFHPSVWVVAWQAVTASMVMLVGFQIASRWRFRLVLERQHLRELFGFSSFVLANDIVVTLSQNAGVFILGRLLSVTDAGVFALAAFMTDTVRKSLMSILNRVTFVHYSQVKHDKAKVRQAYLSTVRWNCRLIFPVMTGCMLFGPPLLTHFLGPKWATMGPVLGWLSLSVMIHASGGTTSTVYKAMGKPGLDMGLFLATTVLLLLPGMVAGAYWYGLVGVAIATAFTKLVSNVIRQVLLDRLIGNTAKAVIANVVLLSLLQAPIVIAWLVGWLVWPQHGWFVDLVLLSIGCAIYGMVELPRAFPKVAAKAGIRPLRFGASLG